jgi:hypothetical protein
VQSFRYWHAKFDDLFNGAAHSEEIAVELLGLWTKSRLSDAEVKSARAASQRLEDRMRILLRKCTSYNPTAKCVRAQRRKSAKQGFRQKSKALDEMKGFVGFGDVLREDVK